jgi:PmbA protein
MDSFFPGSRAAGHDKREIPLVVGEQLSAEHTVEREVYKNTSGAAYETLSGLYALDLSFSGHEGGESSSFFDFSIVFDNLDRPLIELGTLAGDLADAERQIRAEPIDGKFTGTILLHPNCFASLLYSIAANFVSDGAILEGASVWRDKLGLKVADERLHGSVAPYDRRLVWRGKIYLRRLHLRGLRSYQGRKTGKLHAVPLYRQ